jgi:hypothetical protein
VLIDSHEFYQKQECKGERRPTKYRRAFSTNLALSKAQPEEIEKWK